MSEASELNRQLSGNTDVMNLSIVMEEESMTYRILLVLANADHLRKTLEVWGVSSLRMNGFGGGLSQFLCLRATSVSDQQLDRTRFSLRDVESDSIYFECERAVARAE